MLERLAQLLYPGMMTIKPAYGIVQARSSEASSVLYPESQFVLKSMANDRKREIQSAELFFTPCSPTKIVNGAIRYVATKRELFQIENGIQKLSLATASKRSVDHRNKIWLGIELNDEVVDFDGISFFFNWINLNESEKWFDYLPYAHCSIDGVVIRHRPGFIATGDALEPSEKLDKEFDALKKIEQDIIDMISRHYITLTARESIDQLKLTRRKYPKTFEFFFEKNDLQKLNENLFWFEIEFPSIIPDEALDTIFCSINAVPMLNRKLNRLTYKLIQSLNIVPMETNGNFLSMREITNSQGQKIKLLPFANSGNLQPETYTLRYGVNRFDDRDANETLVNLTELIKEESSYFTSLGEDFLIQNIRELNQILARLEDKIKSRQQGQSPYPYLIIRPQAEGSNIMIEYWSSNGAMANKISIGSKLAPYQHANVINDSVFFITATNGGRDRFSDSEKIGQYKKSLLSHGRIVTLEDLKAFVSAELGNSARSVDYKKTFSKSNKEKEGFMRQMEILVEPEPGYFDKYEWEQRLKELHLALENQTTGNIPFLVSLKKT